LQKIQTEPEASEKGGFGLGFVDFERPYMTSPSVMNVPYPVSYPRYSSVLFGILLFFGFLLKREIFKPPEMRRIL
jgi:hypothetical protein